MVHASLKGARRNLVAAGAGDIAGSTSSFASQRRAKPTTRRCLRLPKPATIVDLRLLPRKQTQRLVTDIADAACPCAGKNANHKPARCANQSRRKSFRLNAHRRHVPIWHGYVNPATVPTVRLPCVASAWHADRADVVCFVRAASLDPTKASGSADRARTERTLGPGLVICAAAA